MNTEQKTDQQIDYGMEELIPVVAELTEKFTSAELIYPDFSDDKAVIYFNKTITVKLKNAKTARVFKIY